MYILLLYFVVNYDLSLEMSQVLVRLLAVMFVLKLSAPLAAVCGDQRVKLCCWQEQTSGV